jgi:hypothetical protein
MTSDLRFWKVYPDDETEECYSKGTYYIAPWSADTGRLPWEEPIDKVYYFTRTLHGARLQLSDALDWGESEPMIIPLNSLKRMLQALMSEGV